jgi:hypothetical protein
VKLEVPGKTWLVVLAPPSRMERRGLPRTMLEPGMTASVVGYPNRTDPQEMRAERITISGKTVARSCSPVPVRKSDELGRHAGPEPAPAVSNSSRAAFSSPGSVSTSRAVRASAQAAARLRCCA